MNAALSRQTVQPRVPLRTQEPLWGTAYSTPMGLLAVTASAFGLRSVSFDVDALHATIQDDILSLQAFRQWLDAYFAREFDRLPPLELDPQGAPNDIVVWKAVVGTNPGRTVSYNDLAARIGRIGQARPVAAAVGRNPLLLVIPCHRITAVSGGLHGFSAGIERKAWLLRHEGVLLL